MSEDYGDWQARVGLEINEELLFDTEINEPEEQPRKHRYDAHHQLTDIT